MTIITIMNKSQNVFYVPKIKYIYKETPRYLSYFIHCNPLLFLTEADKNYSVSVLGIYIHRL